MSDALLVGVDGGGTHCRVRIRRPDGTLLGAAEGGTANVFSGIGPAVDNVFSTLRAALARGGEDEAALARCHVGFGLAGASVSSVAAAFSALSLPVAAWALETDALTARRGAFRGADGAIAILGTGSAYAVKANGRTEILGGCGPVVSDQGGGAVLGRLALTEALLAHDGIRPPTALTQALLEGFAHAPRAVAEFARDAKPSDFGRLAPLIWDHFDRGDPVADRLIRDSLLIVEASAWACLGRGAPAIAFLGGQAARYRALLSPDLDARTVEPADDALEGALDLAREVFENRLRGPGTS